MVRIKRMIAGVVAALMIASCITGCSGKPKVTDGNYPATEHFVKELGRYYVDATNGVTWYSLTGTGVEFAYKNCSVCEIELVGDTKAAASSRADHHVRYAIYVNGNRVIDQMLDKAVETISVPLEGTEGTVSVVKLSESADSSFGIRTIHVDGKISATPAKKTKIEFIGDSITCGYGVDGTLSDTFKTSNEDGTKSYAYKTAQALDADYSMVSFSGHGIYSGYSGDGKRETESLIGRFYDKIGNSSIDLKAGLTPKYIGWDHKKFTPDYVVINLGTNDYSYCTTTEKAEEFTAAYVEFLKEVRKANPKAMIICSLGIMGQELCMNVLDAVSKYSSETGDGKIDYLQFDVQSGGFGVDYHPTEKSHEHAAEQLIQFIRELGK